jgi:hypothetical protein
LIIIIDGKEKTGQKTIAMPKATQRFKFRLALVRDVFGAYGAFDFLTECDFSAEP